MSSIYRVGFSFLRLTSNTVNTIWHFLSYLINSVKVIHSENSHLNSISFHVFVFLFEHNNRIHESLGFDVALKVVFGLRQEFSVVKILLAPFIFVDVLNVSLLNEFSLDNQMKLIERFAFCQDF